MLLAVHLLRATSRPMHIVLIERQLPIGRGVAYDTRYEHHLLNVLSGKMGAYAERPDHFLQWLGRATEISRGLSSPEALSFVPRHLYGDSLYDVLEEAKAASTSGIFEHVHDNENIAEPCQSLYSYLI